MGSVIDFRRRIPSSSMIRSVLTGSVVFVVASLTVAGGVALAAKQPVKHSKKSTSHPTVIVTSSKNQHLGTLLTSGGRTLYTLKATKVACTATCESIWPEVTVPKGGVRALAKGGVKASKLGTVSRPRGVRQVTYSGKPLYRFSGDTTTGTANGNGLTDQWGTWSAVVLAKPKVTKTTKSTKTTKTVARKRSTTTTSGSSYGY